MKKEEILEVSKKENITKKHFNPIFVDAEAILTAIFTVTPNAFSIQLDTIEKLITHLKNLIEKDPSINYYEINCSKDDLDKFCENSNGLFRSDGNEYILRKEDGISYAQAFQGLDRKTISLIYDAVLEITPEEVMLNRRVEAIIEHAKVYSIGKKQ